MAFFWYNYNNKIIVKIRSIGMRLQNILFVQRSLLPSTYNPENWTRDRSIRQPPNPQTKEMSG